jgi:Regulator of chromosome condensation (RCC1) repeat/Carbohydrate binding domain
MQVTRSDRSADRQYSCWTQSILNALAAVALCSVSAIADTGVVAWGTNSNGQLPTPSGLMDVRALSAGFYFSAALRESGAVVCWGDNSSGQCNVPLDLPPIRALSAGNDHVVALTQSGSVVCWGNNFFGQCNVPPDLSNVSGIAAGGGFSIALVNNGTLRCWGSNSAGQCSPPPSMGPVNLVVGGGSHAMALSAQQTLWAWGNNDYGQVSVPSELPAVRSMAAGGWHSLAILSDGSVRCWGRNSESQCLVPPNLGDVIQVAGGLYHSAALSVDGQVTCWGYNANGQCNIPQGLPPAALISAGYLHTAAVVCLAPTYAATSGNLGPIGSGVPRQFTFAGVPAAAGPVALTVKVRSDLNLATEFMSVRLNGAPFATIFTDTGLDCPANPDSITLQLSAKQFNVLASSGSLSVSLEASAGVSATQCADGYSEILLDFVATDADCNANGIEDRCEVVMPGRDCNSNGVPDDCDLASGSSHDVDADGAPDECQPDCNANQIPDQYEIATGLTADCNQNALPDACEVADPGPNLVANGGFDSGANGWTVSHVDGSGGWRGSGGHPAGMFILNDGGGATDPTIEQTITGLAPGTSYSISGDFIGGSQANSPSGAISFAVDLNGTTLFNAPATDTTNWRSFSVTFVAASTSAQLRLRAEINSTDNDFAVDNIAVFIASSAPDCNDNGVPDSCDIAAGAAADCNGNSIPDSCDIARGTSADVDSNGVPDTCQTDCNANALPDSYEIAQNPSRDCNSNAQLDWCEIAANAALDCDLNGKLDSCDVQEPFADCDGNGKLDRCDIAQGAQDKDFDGWIDACEIARGDFNLDGEVNGADLAELLSLWGFPDPPYGDLNGDGVVSAPDLSIFLGNWGTIPWPEFSRLFFEPNGVFEVPAGVTSVRVLLVGGGGGGANGHMGGGGSGFVYATVVSVVPGQQIPVVVGRGGLGAQTTSDNSIIGNTAGSMSAFGSTNSVSGGDTPNGGQGAAGGSGGGGACNSGNPGGTGGTAGSNGLVPPCGTAGGLGQGSSFATSLSMFWRRQISAGVGGAGGTSSHSAGGGGGGVLINGIGPFGSDGPQSFSGRGGHGFGGGGGGGGYEGSLPPYLRWAGGNGANGAVYIEW